MNSKILKSISLFLIATFFITSCVNDDQYDTPPSGIVTYNLTPTKTVQDVYPISAAPTQYIVADDIIEAYVTSSDDSGNFFNSISFQTIPTDGSAPRGFSISIELKSYGEGFTPGRKVYIKLKDLYIALVDGSMKIGDIYQGSIGRIPNYKWKNHLFLSDVIVPENSFVRTLTLTQAAVDANINTLIDIDNIQFADQSLARTYFDVDNGGSATNHNIVDVTTGGTQRFFRVSEFSLFARQSVPSGRGKIRGVMSKFSTDFQFLIRNENDVKLTNPRNYSFSGAFTENFESFAVNQKSFSNYLNFDTKGTKNWLVKTGKFLEMSSFSGNIESNKSYFVVPVDMTAANTFTFQVRAQFYNGSSLKVYRTTNYVPGMKITDANLFDITTNFTLPSATTTAFASAGTYNIPNNVIGNGYFVFVYEGTNISTGPAVTTTMQIDNIIVN
jgi:hypothetical protein